MNTKISNKIVSIALAATTLVSLSGAVLPVVAQAQSAATLQAQIASLLATIQQLQAQLNAQTGTSVSSFTRDLTVGSKGSDVMALQQFLNAHGAMVAASGAGSPGSETSTFGPATKAALMKWQSAQGITPVSGYFGPKSRAAVSAVGGGTTVTPSPTPSGTPAPNAPASGMVVTLASDNPAPGSLIPSSSRNRVLRVTFTAGNASPVTISEIKFHKQGVLSDSSISGAYITEAGRVLAQYNSISSGVIDFNNLALTVGAGQSRTFSLAIDPASGLSAGNTVSFSLSAASDITSWDSGNNPVNEMGVFPVNGNLFTVTTVSNPSLATLTIASSSIGTNVTAGTTNNLIAAWNFNAGNSRVNLGSIKFTVIGSANKADIRNLKLMVNGTQVGATLASVGADGAAYFDASAAPGVLNTGSNNIQINADVMGSPSYNFQFEILNSYDVYAVDSQYNVPVLAASNVGTQVTIKTGTITVSQAPNTPTGNIATGQSAIALAKFTVAAAGEAVKIKWLGVGLNLTGASGTIDSFFKNLSLVDDAGSQVGTTINTLSTSVTCTTDSNGGVSFSAGGNSPTTYRNCFGNSSSPINYTIPSNTTRVLTLVADIQAATTSAGYTTFTTVTGVLTGNANNLQGLTSSQIASVSGVNGAALTLVSSNLTTVVNSALGTQNISANTTNKRIGSYAFTASSAEGVTVNNISITPRSNSLSNVKVMISGVQFGATQGSVASGTTYSFSGTPFTVPAGVTQLVDVYADTLSSASGAVLPITSLSGCSASGAVSLTAISCTTASGQGVTFAGQSALTITTDSATPASQELVMGSTGNTLAIFRFTETSNVEDIKITDMNIFDVVGTSTQVGASNLPKSAFANVSIYNGSTLLGSAGTANTSVNTSGTIGASGVSSSVPGLGYYYSFHFTTPVIVPQANSISLTLKGDVASYASSGATDNTTHVFKISPSSDTANAIVNLTVAALGSTSNASSVITLSTPASNNMTVLRSKMTVSATPLGAITGRSKANIDDLATLTFAANSAGGVQIGSVTLFFSGSGPSSTPANVSTTQASFWVTAGNGAVAGTKGNSSLVACATCNVTLYDTATGISYWAVASGTTGGSSLTYDLGNYQLSNGSSKGFNVRINSNATAAFNTAASGVAQTLGITINAATNVTWQDSLDSAASGGLSLESYLMPINIASVNYAQGI